MGLFSKTELEELVKYLSKKEISYEIKDKLISFEIAMKKSSYSLFPYLKINEDGLLSFCVNIKNVKTKDGIYEKMNNFNLKSKFYVAKIKEDILFLEYNAYTFDNIVELFKELLDELFVLEEEIDNL